VAIDIGGTFTDLVALDEESGKILNIKVPSTPKEPGKAVVEAFREFLAETDKDEVSVVVHATTLATNALLGQVNLELPETALIATKGFRDIIEIGRQRRHELYNLFTQKPRALIPRRLRFEVEERIGPKGEVLTPLNEEQVESISKQLERERVRSVAISLLFSHLNQKHELEIYRLLKDLLPQIYLTLGSQVSPEYREYERTSTAVVNAVLMPIISGYLDTLGREIGRLGINAPLFVMQSDGGIATKAHAFRRPVCMVESGPAAGVIASAFLGEALGIGNVLSFDMGGTTAKAGAVKEAKPEIVSEYEVAGKVHSGRIVKGSGYPVRTPFVDLAECSAGGGTIAWVDQGKALRVGPISAGADPGPACYGKGGGEPTVTDANVLLGRLNPRYMLGGRMKIYPELSKRAITQNICNKIGLELTEAAAGIIRIANSAMAKILRIVSIERGHDPRDFVLMCFGGAGPVHGCSLAEELGITTIVVPTSPGLFSAYGLLAADLKVNLAKAMMSPIDRVDAKEVEAIFENLGLEGAELLKEQRVPKDNMIFVHLIDLRYIGQSYEMPILTSRPFNKETLNQAVEDFHKKHKAVYGYSVTSEPVELVNVKLTAIGLAEKPKLKKQPLHKEKPPREAIIASRKVFFDQDSDYLEASVFERERLKAGSRINGPAIIEQYDATTVVNPDWTASVDAFTNVILSVKGGN